MKKKKSDLEGIKNLYLIPLFLFFLVASVNEYALKGLDKMEENLPVLHQPANQVRQEMLTLSSIAFNFCFFFLRYSIQRNIQQLFSSVWTYTIILSTWWDVNKPSRRWCQTPWVWSTSRWRVLKMLWWKPWGGVWRWPGQQSAEVSSAPWATGWARWSAAGWAWRWAAPRNGSTTTCPWRRGSWVSSSPERRKSQSEHCWSVIERRLIYRDWRIKLRNDCHQVETVAESVSPGWSVLFLEKGGRTPPLWSWIQKKAWAVSSTHSFWHLLLRRYVIQTTWWTLQSIWLWIWKLLQCDVCGIQVVSTATVFRLYRY